MSIPSPVKCENLLAGCSGMSGYAKSARRCYCEFMTELGVPGSAAEQSDAVYTSVIAVPEPGRIQIGDGRPEVITSSVGDWQRRREMRLKSIYTDIERPMGQFMPATLVKRARYHDFEVRHGEVASVGRWLLRLKDPAVGNIYTRYPYERTLVLQRAEGVELAAHESLTDTVTDMYVQENLGRLALILEKETAAVEGVSNHATQERRRLVEAGEIVASLIKPLAIWDKIDSTFFRDIHEIADTKDFGDDLGTPMTPAVEKMHIDKAMKDLSYRQNFRTADPIT